MTPNIPTWSESISGKPKGLSEKGLAIKWAIIWATTLLLQACSQAWATESPKQDASEVTQMAQLSQTVQPRVINASVSVSESTQEVDISKLSIPELQAERQLVKTKIASLEANMDNLTDADWDALDWYNQRLIDLAKAETAAEKERTRIAKLLTWNN